jgi:hypothetical protein
MTQEAVEVQPAKRRRGILFVPIALLLAIFGVALADAIFLAAGLVCLLIIAVGLPPATSNDSPKPDWAGRVGVGLFCCCGALLLWGGSQWINSDWLITLGSLGLGALLVVAFGGRFALDVLAKQRLDRLKKHAMQYVALAAAAMFLFLASFARLPAQIRFMAEKPSLDQAMREVEAKCASAAAPIPTLDGKPLVAWNCTATSTSFTSGTWSEMFTGGQWGFTRSSVMPTAGLNATETPASASASASASAKLFTKLNGEWWFWKSTTWVD